MASIRGTANDDSLIGAADDDEIRGLDGNDFIDGRRGADVLRGGAGSDTIIGGLGADRLLGGTGNDSINPGRGADVASGGAGFDFLIYEDAAAGIAVDLAGGTATDADGLTDAVDGFEAVVGSAFDDVLSGDAEFNSFVGAAGNDLMDGVNVAAGNEVRYDFSPAGVAVDLEAGTAADGYGTTDTLRNIDNVTGSEFDDQLRGSSTTGFETFLGLAGDDLIEGGGGSDNQADYRSSPAGVIVRLTEGTAEDGHGTTDTLIGINRVRGSDFDDRIVGSDSEFEVFRPGAGDDVVFGRGGTDRIDLRDSVGPVTVDLLDGTARDDQGGTDVFRSIEQARGGDFNDELRGDGGDNLLGGLDGDDRLEGSGGADRLLGEGGDDTLLGGAGDDLLEGGLGADVLRGGAGADTYAFIAADEGVDRIIGLGAADVIDIGELLNGFAGDPEGFVGLVDDGGDAILQVDADGGGDDFVDLAVISGAAGTSLDELIAGGNLVLGDGATS